jgi:hypothetical protein
MAPASYMGRFFGNAVLRQDVQQKTAEKLDGRERHASLLAALLVVLEQEGDLAVGEGDDAVVGDGDAVGIAAEISEDVLGAAKGRLGIDDQVLGAELVLEAAPRQRMGEFGRGACEVELAPTICLVQRVEKQTAEELAEHLHGYEIVRPCRDPVHAVRGEPAAGDDAVQVRMEQQVLSPGVQDGREADLRAQVIGILRDRQQRAGAVANRMSKMRF